ncbi:ABC-type transport system involved in multi-copper enzyme maturation permease subunit [Kineococcus radiotolerans]|uniref:ABC-type transport system involved in multi-copper enzyme maturation permease subunit n=1 Tax=Kineococcus radiotolerans TaxID=131568 RepID=A0A7W4TKV8_KINRA|nr:ABC transporter permease [Kineococcus radiotolerans]MBB2900779.1 ABC-type transport system involved in multi-copper enzyme maturation permease subunit [Kineococcus radiotolerans]
MSATTFQAQQFVPVERRVTFPGLLRSEWIKFWSVRSVVVTMAVSFVAIVGLGVLISFATRSALGDVEGAQAMAANGVDATGASMTGAQLASLIVAAVGVIVIAGEFSTGMIRTSFAVAPGRIGVYLAKALVLAVNVAVLMGVAVFAAFFLGQAVLEARGFGASIGDDHVLRALLGNVVLLVGVALAGLGVGALLRNSAGAICTVLAAIFVVPLLLMAVPESWGGDTLSKYFFANTTTNLAAVVENPAFLAPGAGLAAFALWVAVLLGLGGLAVKTRDV